MTTIADAGPGILDVQGAVPGDAAPGWYLYGVTRRGRLDDVLAEADATPWAGEHAPLELLESAGLTAIVRQVRLADFDPAVLRQRLQDAEALEAMVRGHNRVIDRVHERQAILPARFGVVYAGARDIVAALRNACGVLLPQLHRLEGCDEWAVHVHADRAVVQAGVAAREPELGRLRAAHAAARPGRAYFLERQMRDALEGATRQALASLAQHAFDRMASAAVDAQVAPVPRDADARGAESEILRAAFLVSRDALARFEAAASTDAGDGQGLRYECTGPWAPYSFAVGHALEAS